ncbi:MAG TPA: DUF6166 domain-containing protein [Acidimicrobiia bacterium]|nr:DUF6166 domain-containing protein [Acidimicrobiia bacterium]
MTSALLTGSKERTSPLAATLRAHSGDVVVAESRDGIAGLAARLPARSVGSYVQLLLAPDGAASWAALVTERIETLALLAPLLAPEAVVVMVAEDAADPARDRRVVDALCLLAEAALTAGGGNDVRVSVVDEASPATITRLLPGAAPRGGQGPLADFGADRAYADWRTDVLNLTSTSDVTYLGWLNQEGQRRVGLLRKSVVSPLPFPPDSGVAWGDTGPGARALGRALIGETLGGQDFDEALVELFVKDVIDRLPATDFELSSRELTAWLYRNRPGQSPGAAS